jgi:hypothetical protein
MPEWTLPSDDQITVHLRRYIDEWGGDNFVSAEDNIDVDVLVDIDDQDLDLSVSYVFYTLS